MNEERNQFKMDQATPESRRISADVVPNYPRNYRKGAKKPNSKTLFMHIHHSTIVLTYQGAKYYVCDGLIHLRAPGLRDVISIYRNAEVLHLNRIPKKLSLGLKLSDDGASIKAGFIEFSGAKPFSLMSPDNNWLDQLSLIITCREGTFCIDYDAENSERPQIAILPGNNAETIQEHLSKALSSCRYDDSIISETYFSMGWNPEEVSR